MRDWQLRLACLMAAFVGVASGGRADALQTVIGVGNRAISVAEGYEIELVAGPPLVERPIAVARDEQGRLYVTDSGGMSERAEQQLEERPHRIRRLEDTDGDGVYDRSTLFADRMMFPEGCLWRDGSLYVAAPPEIWKLTDVDDDGMCDRRDVWFDGQTLTGCGNDLHGPYEGPDGWMYWCKGAFAEQRHMLGNGREFVTRSSHIFRSRLDGSGLEPVLTGGMDNPVNVAFLNTGDRFLSCTFFQYPAAGRRDGLLHAVYGGVYGKRHDSIFEHQQTGDVMPVLVHEGAAAPCGLIAGSRSLFRNASPSSLYACYFNLHQVVRHQLSPAGATWTTNDQIFVSSDHPDFHPTDVFEDADGSLLIVDTGGWYKVCCPTSLLAKPEMLGGIYRVRRTGITPLEDPMGIGLDRETTNSPALAGVLASRLDDDRLFVRRRATRRLREHGVAAVPALSRVLQTHPHAMTRCEAVWTLAGIEGPAARAAVRAGLHDPDETVLLAALNVVSLHRDPEALPDLMRLLAAGNPRVSRAAAEALGRSGHPDAVPALMTAVSELPIRESDDTGAPLDGPDRVLHHSLVYALIESDRADVIRPMLAGASPQTTQAALIALDQMHHAALTVQDALTALSSEHEFVRRTASWVIGHHPEWGEALVGHFRSVLAGPLSAAEEEQTVALLAQLSSSESIQQFLAEYLAMAGEPRGQGIALRAIRSAQLTQVPAAWNDALANSLTVAEPSRRTRIVETALALSPAGKVDGHLGDALRLVAESSASDPVTRTLAAGCVGPLGAVSDDLFGVLLETTSEPSDGGLRGRAAELIGTAELSSEQRGRLLAQLPEIGPMELPRVLPAFSSGGSAEAGMQLVTALASSDARFAIRQDQAAALFQAWPEDVRAAGQELLAPLFATAVQQSAEIDAMLQSLPEASAQRGQEIFIGQKAACITCHKLGYHGGTLGPDLTTIGRIRKPRELLEAILFPSATIVRGYEPVTLELHDGRVLAGIISGESADHITLGIDGQKSARIRRSEIADMVPSAISPMPQGINRLLNSQEIADILSFLTRPQ